MEKGLFVYLLIFLVLIGASLTFANTDQITPTVAEAQAEMAVGPTTVQTVEKGVSWLLKLTVGAVAAGIAAAVFTEVRKAYKAWKRDSTARRWQPGPNAKWQQQPQQPKLRREDLLLLALSGKYPIEQLQTKTGRGSMRVASSEDDDFELEI